MNKEKSIILNKLLESDSSLKSELLDLYDFNYCIEDNLDYEDHLTVNELQIVNYVLQKHNHQTIFEFQDEPVSYLIAENLENWAEDLITELEFEYRNCDIEFRTDYKGDLELKRLLEQNVEPTGMYLVLSAPNGSTIMAEIEFDNFDKSTDSLIKLINNVKSQMTNEIKKAIYDFDPDEEFNALWGPQLSYSARDFLEILDQDQEFFQGRLEYL
jgi:hypothetical protein